MYSNIKIKNINGTSRFQVPKGYDSWLDYWEQQKGEVAQWCSADDCETEIDLVGAHVQKANSADKNYYIVPLCKKCNKRMDIFNVPYDLLVPVPSNL